MSGCKRGGRGELAHAGDPLSPDLTEALAVLDAQRLVQAGLRRCQARARSLVRAGAMSGGDSADDRSLDRTLRDRLLLGEMKADLQGALTRVRERVRRSLLEELLGQVPLASLQRDVLLDRLGGASWPRIAAVRTRGDRGSAVRAFRQAGARVRATAAVLAVLRSTEVSEARDVAERTGLTVRMVNRIRRHLDRDAQMRRTGWGAGGGPSRSPWTQPRPIPRRGRVELVELPEGDPNRPNPGAWAEPCDVGKKARTPEPFTWRVLQVRPGAELHVKVAIERLLGEEVRCRALRAQRGQSGVAGYLALACRRPEVADVAITGVAGVVGWVGEGGGLDAGRGPRPVLAPVTREAAADVAAWLDPRRVRP